MDRLTQSQRSRLMATVKAKDTGPERIVRSALHMLGLRFRLHVRSLPGTPDVVMPKHRTIVLIHGCFWHAHCCRRGRKTPRTNSDYWIGKRKRNRRRDRGVRSDLRKLGWRVIEIWECQTRDRPALVRRLRNFFE